MASRIKLLRSFTREAGKVTAMARGAKKPTSSLAAVSQPFTYGYFLSSKGRGMGTLATRRTIMIRCDHIREDI